MPTATLMEPPLQREGNLLVERYKITVARTAAGGVETAAFDLTSKRIKRIKTIEGNCTATIVSGTTNKVRIANFPLLQQYVIDDIGVTGTDDFNFNAANAYTGTAPAIYTVKITNAASNPDEFQWKKNDGSFSASVQITGAFQALSDGVQIMFTGVNGHTLNDQWIVTAHPLTTDFYLTLKGYGG